MSSLFNKKTNQVIGFNGLKLIKTSVLTISIVTLTSLTGCQTVKGVTGGLFNKDKSDTVVSSEKSEEGYYLSAVEDIDKRNYIRAASSLKDLRTFYPTGRFSQQAMLDLMYVEFQQQNYDEAITQANQFIGLYPNNQQVDYAHYLRGVSNMANVSKSAFFLKMNPAERDTVYYRLAFNNFAELLRKYPNSIYAPDAAKRMTYIYNQFAEHELHAARWYIERESYVAAANRAKWIFQYYPQSQSIPESIATLAYSYEQLGINDLATEYKTLLQINYPEWLDAKGNVRLSNGKQTARSLVNKLSFGKLGRSSSDNVSKVVSGNNSYNGTTKQQTIRGIAQLRLPNS